MNNVLFFEIVNQQQAIVHDLEKDIQQQDTLLTDYNNLSITDTITPKQLPTIALQLRSIFELQKKAVFFIEEKIKCIRRLFEAVQDYVILHGDTIVPKKMIETHDYIFNYQKYSQFIQEIKQQLKKSVGNETLFTPYETCYTLHPFYFPILQTDTQTVRPFYLYRPKIIKSPYSWEDIQEIITKKPNCYQGTQVTATHYYFTEDTLKQVLIIIGKIETNLAILRKQHCCLKKQIDYC